MLNAECWMPNQENAECRNGEGPAAHRAAGPFAIRP